MRLNNSVINFIQETEGWDLTIPTQDALGANGSDEVTIFENNTALLYNISEKNTTLNIQSLTEKYQPIVDWLLLLMLIIVMLCVGCEITWEHLYHHMKRPIGLIIGIVSQFVIMPLTAYTILRLTHIQGLQATAVLIISCCPGGVLSNIFSYSCEGDLSLSVAMTCASTMMAMGMMPLNVWLYGRHFETDDLVMPYSKMAISLISLTSPVVVGMLLKWKLPRVAAFTAKLIYSGILLMFICVIMELILFPNMFSTITATLYVFILSFPILGMTLGYGVSFLLRQTKPIRKTISIECGIQNVPLALTIITRSFPLKMQEDMVLLPWLYGFAMLTSGSVLCLIYNCYKKYSKKPEVDSISEDIDSNMKQVPLLLNGENGNIHPSNGIKVEIKPSVLTNH